MRTRSARCCRRPRRLVIVTSRSQLAGLAAADRARLLTLDVLSHDEARAGLLTARIGARPGRGRAWRGPPRSLPCAGGYRWRWRSPRPAPKPGLTSRWPRSPRAEDRAGRLDALDTGDPAASVRAVFSWSYRQLSAGAARMFRLLGLHPGPDISAARCGQPRRGSYPEASRQLASSPTCI